MPRRTTTHAARKQASEHDHQKSLIRWADLALPGHESALLFAIPNGGHRHKATAAKLKQEGVRRGIPDLFLAIPTDRHHGLFIEMKRAIKKGTPKPRTTAHQDRYLAAFAAMGYKAEVCHGWEDAANAVARYLGRPDLAIT